MTLAPHAPAPRVAASEHEILTLARALLVGPAGLAEASTVFAAERTLPSTIGPTCATLLADTLRTTWRALVLRGGALPGRTIAAPGTIGHGRVWQRHAPAPLAFTGATLALLRWLVATPLAQPLAHAPVLPAQPLAVGDEVLVYVALEAARGTAAARALAAQPFVQATALAWLGAPELLALAEPAAATAPPFTSLVTAAGAVVIDALGPALARHWAALERTKRAATNPHALLALGRIQDLALGGFMRACDGAGRRDLAAWIVDAAAPGLAATADAPEPRRLDPGAPLAVRSRARVAAGALLRAVRAWATWDHAHRGVRFFEDEYAVTQLLLERFEPIGAAGAERAASWLEALAALYPAGHP